MKNRLFSLLLVLAMVLSMVPVLASAATATPSIEQVSMTLNGVLDVNFKVASNGGDMSKCSVAVSGAVAQTVTEYTRDGDLYVYTVKVPAHKLPETLNVSLMYNGEAVQNQEWTADESYLSKLSGSATLTALADALANYGTYAAAYAAGEATEAIDGITAEKLQVYKPVISVKNAALGAVASLYLDDACDLTVKFNSSAWQDTYKLTIDGSEVPVSNNGSGKMVASVEALLPQDWSTMYDIQVLNGTDVIFACSYGVNSYVYQALSRATEAATGLNNLLKSMYAYSAAAVAYAPASRTAVALSSFYLRDPFILNDGDAYYLYGTKDNGSFNVWSSTDLNMWYDEGACYTVEAGDIYYDTTNSEIAFWAPEVYEYNGAYYMFATFTQAGTDNQQGTAILKAESPLGPFEKWSEDVVTPWAHSCLDGTLYIENGVPYMIYAHEWQCAECDDDMGSMAYIQLSDDLKTTVGYPVELFEAQDLTGYSWFQTTFGGKDNANVTDGPFVYTDEDGQKYLLWSTSVDDGNYVQVYTTFDSLSDGIDAASNSVQVYTDDGGHGMIFTDMNGVDKLVLHTPNTGSSRAALFNVTVADAKLSLEGVKLWDGYQMSRAEGYASDAITENTTIFIGDSFFDISFWDNFAVDLAGKDAKIYGIGGSTTEDWYHYAMREIFLDGSGVAPKNIVVNLGNNDYYNDGLTAEEALENYAEYYTALHENYPTTKIYAFSTVARTGDYANATAAAEMTEGNSLMNTWCADKDWITFIDITGLIPSGGLYDGIHPYDEYYTSVYLTELLEAGCVIEDVVDAKFYTQSYSSSISVDNTAGTLTYAGADTTELYFMANATETHAENWEMTGTITKNDVSSSLFFSFGLRDEDGKDQWFCFFENGFGRQRYYNWYDTAVWPNGTTIYENYAQYNFFTKANAVLSYKVIVNGDTMYVYFGNDTQALHLTWILDLTDETYGGFTAGSSYQLAINTVDACAMTISNVTVSTDNGDPAAAKYYVASKNPGVFSDLIPDTLEGALTYRGNGGTEIYFMANETDTYAKNWEMTGKITKTNASTGVFFSFGVLDSDGNEQWFCILNQSSLSLQRYWNWYTNRKYVDNVNVFSTPAGNAFFGDSTNTSAVLDYKVVLEGDVLKVYFGNDDHTMRLAWYLPLTDSTFGGFTAGSSYQLALNSVDPCPMTISNMEITTNNDTVAVAEDNFYVYSNTTSITASPDAGVLVYSGAESETQLHFQASETETYAKNWEMTGRITKDTVSNSLFTSFGVIDTAGNEQWFCFLENGVSFQWHWNWWDNVQWPNGTNIVTNQAQYNFFLKSCDVLDYKLVLEDDVLYVYFGNDEVPLALTWTLDLTSSSYGGFAADSGYRLSIRTVDACALTITDASVTASDFVEVTETEEPDESEDQEPEGTVYSLPNVTDNGCPTENERVTHYVWTGESGLSFTVKATFTPDTSADDYGRNSSAMGFAFRQGTNTFMLTEEYTNQIMALTANTANNVETTRWTGSSTAAMFPTANQAKSYTLTYSSGEINIYAEDGTCLYGGVDVTVNTSFGFDWTQPVEIGFGTYHGSINGYQRTGGGTVQGVTVTSGDVYVLANNAKCGSDKLHTVWTENSGTSFTVEATFTVDTSLISGVNGSAIGFAFKQGDNMVVLTENNKSSLFTVGYGTTVGTAGGSARWTSSISDLQIFPTAGEAVTLKLTYNNGVVNIYAADGTLLYGNVDLSTDKWVDIDWTQAVTVGFGCWHGSIDTIVRTGGGYMTDVTFEEG